MKRFTLSYFKRLVLMLLAVVGFTTTSYAQEWVETNVVNYTSQEEIDAAKADGSLLHRAYQTKAMIYENEMIRVRFSGYTEYLAFKVNVSEPGIYKMTLDMYNGDNRVKCQFRYHEGSFDSNGGTLISSESIDIPLYRQTVESNEFEIKNPGIYYFAYHRNIEVDGMKYEYFNNLRLLKKSAPAATTYQVSLAPVENGEVKVYKEGSELNLPAEVEEGTTLTVETKAEKGYKLTALTAGSEDIMTSKSFTVNAATTITATFTQEDYTLTKNVAPEGTGKISVTKNSVEVGEAEALHYGDVITVTATPINEYYVLDGAVSVKGATLVASTENQYKVEDNVTVTANFKAVTYSVTVNATNCIVKVTDKDGGEITDLKAVAAGTELKVTVTPTDANYTLSSLTYRLGENGQERTLANEGTFALTDDAVITAVCNEVVAPVVEASYDNIKKPTVTICNNGYKKTQISGEILNAEKLSASSPMEFEPVLNSGSAKDQGWSNADKEILAYAGASFDLKVGYSIQGNGSLTIFQLRSDKTEGEYTMLGQYFGDWGVLNNNDLFASLSGAKDGSNGFITEVVDTENENNATFHITVPDDINVGELVVVRFLSCKIYSAGENNTPMDQCTLVYNDDPYVTNATELNYCDYVIRIVEEPATVETFDVTLNKPENGNITVAYADQTVSTADFETDETSRVLKVEKNAELTVTATPADDYKLATLTYTVGDVSTEITEGKVTVTSAMTIAATFTEATTTAETFDVTLNKPENGNISVAYADQTVSTADFETDETSRVLKVEKDTELTVTTTPADDYELATLTYTVEETSTDIKDGKVTVTSDMTIAATFTEKEPVLSAIRIPATESNQHYQFRFDDIDLGSHNHGNYTDDTRSRNITMSAWIKLNSTADGQVMGYGQKQYWNCEGTFSLRLKDGAYVLKNRSRTGEDGTVAKEEAADAVTTQQGETDKWAFVTVVYDDTNKKRYFYYNGNCLVDEAIANLGLGILNDESVFYVSNNDLSLDLDEVQVWNKALTREEIVSSMTSVNGDEEGLIYLYRFTEKNDDYTYNNMVGESTTTASLVKGTYAYDSSAYANIYTASTVEAEQVEGHTDVVLPASYAITWTAPDAAQGTLVVKNGDDELNSGDKVLKGTTLTVEATAETGYKLTALTYTVDEGEAQDIMESKSFKVTGDTEIAAVFAELAKYKVEWTTDPAEGTLAVSYTDADNETVTVESGKTEIPENTELTVTVTAEDGYSLKSLSYKVGEDGEPVALEEEPYTFKLTGNTTLTAEFEKDAVEPVTYKVEWTTDPAEGTLAVSYTDADDKTVTVESGKTEIPENTELTVTVTTEDGYSLKSLSYTVGEDGTPVVLEEAPYTFKLTGNTTLSAVFEKDGSSINSLSADGIYYNAAEEVLYTASAAMVKVYDLSGRLVLNAENQETVSVAGLADGIYTAVVDGKVLKFNK